MATKASKFALGQLATVYADCAGETVAQDFYYDAAAADIVLNDVIDIGILPAGMTVSDAILLSDDLDSNGTPLIALDVGIMSGTPGDTVNARTCGNELFAADQAARTGVAARMSKVAGFNIQPVDYDRSIGVKFQAAAATAQAGRIRLRVWMHSAAYPQQF